MSPFAVEVQRVREDIVMISGDGPQIAPVHQIIWCLRAGRIFPLVRVENGAEGKVELKVQYGLENPARPMRTVTLCTLVPHHTLVRNLLFPTTAIG